MSTAVANKSSSQVARSPSVLVPLIKTALAAVEKNQQEVANLFVEAREGFNSNAELYSWAHRHFDVGERQTDRYLSAGKHLRISRPIGREAPLSLDKILRDAGQIRPTSGRVVREWQPDVDAIADRARREQERIARAAEDELTRKQEREAQRELSLRIIDIGYKVLAKELHPDKGGSRDMMARLNRARDHLKQMA